MSKSPADILKARFHRFLHRRKGDGKVVDMIARQFRSEGWTVYAFGGTPRGVQDAGSTYRPRDLDLVFADSDFNAFESLYKKQVIRRNSFGGLKLKIENVVIDAWPLSATWAFRNGYVKNPSWDNLPATTFLNVDGIIIEFAPKVLKDRKLFECNFFDGWNSKTLDINLEKNPLPSVCVARTLVISRHFGFSISVRLADYLLRMLGNISLTGFERAQQKHYGEVRFDAIALREIRGKIEAFLAKNDTNPLTLFPPIQPDLFDSFRQSPCLNCPDLPPEIKNFIKWEKDDPDESFIKNLIETGFDFFGRIKSESHNNHGRRTNRKRQSL